MLRSTFLGFKAAGSALKVNQNLLDIVGQNISNVNTEGYTRQRLDISSVSFSTNNLKYGVNGPVVGQGVATTGISQYRDSFLDLRYRMAASKSGAENVQLDALSDLESVFDEINKDGLDAQFSDFIKKLQSLTSSPTDPVIEGVVRTSASLICQMFNNYSEQIDTIKQQYTGYLKEGAIVNVNQLIKNISKLNKEIKEDNISGNPALELNDQRNMLIDELSSYLEIEVKVNPISIGGGREIDILSIDLLGGSGVNLINGESFKSLDMIKDSATGNIDISIEGTNIINSINKGQISGYLKFLNGKGSFGTPEYNGIQYYDNMLDTLANKFAQLLNDANRDDINSVDKPLFGSRNGEPISAGNIKIHDDWAKTNSSYITNTKKASPSGDNSGNTENILYMISLFNSKQDFSTGSGVSLFKGKMQEFFSFTATNLSIQIDDVQKSYDTYSETQYQIDYARNSYSSVNLDEEGVSLLTYSKSYNAAARLMTTLDEMLDTLINRMAV